MQVSKLLGFLILAMLIGVCFSLAPVSAGEHPWNDEQLVDSTSVVANNPNQNDDPEDPEDPNSDEELLGTPLFFLKFVVDDSAIGTGEDNSTPGIESTGTSDGPGND